jgi:hypothetical protein
MKEKRPGSVAKEAHMLTVNADVVCRLIDLSHIYHGQEGTVIPDEMDNAVLDSSVSIADSPADDAPGQMAAGHGDETAFMEFKSITEELDPDHQQEIVALLWLGRGDYTLEEWDSIVEQARDQWTPETADYLIDHPLLAAYLQDGLELHGYDCSEASRSL